MVDRLAKLSKSNSFFLFGARGTGKTTLLKSFLGAPDTLYIDLLSPSEYENFLRDPESLRQRIAAADSNLSWVIIDEIQRVPPLLDLVHQLIEETTLKFILTGSSSRKLKRGGGNLLAGRAFVFELFPFTHNELGDRFDLKKVMQWGSLPKIFDEEFSEQDRELYLQAYTRTYLKEEIQEEQIVRNLKKFLLFLDIAAQMNGKILNYRKIGKDLGVDTKTVQNYFDILEETHVGYRLQAFSESLRKRQNTNPKFYYFDIGVQRSLQRVASFPVTQGTYEFGNIFEHFIVLECIRLNSYLNKKFRFSYLKTHNDTEIDLIIDRPREKTILCEIKSTNKVSSDTISSLLNFKKEFSQYEYYCLSLDEVAKDIEGVHCVYWREGLALFFDL